MPKKIDWKFVRSFVSQDELDDYLDSSRPTTIAKSNLNSCTLCPSDLIEPHKMRSQYLNCNSKLCGPKCQARYLVLNCENAGKIDFYSINEHVYNPSPELPPADHQVEDHLSRKCKKIIEFIIVEKHITKPRFILRDLQQNEAHYELASIPSLQQITSYARNKLHNMKTKGFLPLKYKSYSFGPEAAVHQRDESEPADNPIMDTDMQETGSSGAKVEREESVSDKLGQIELSIEMLEKSQKRQMQFTSNYFEDIESRLRENKAKMVKEIDKNYQLFAERINYLKNKFKIDYKIESGCSELDELKRKSERLRSKCEACDNDVDSLDLLSNEAGYVSEELEASLAQIDQHIANVKRIRYEPGKVLSESAGLLGDLFYVDDESNKKRKLDF